MNFIQFTSTVLIFQRIYDSDDPQDSTGASDRFSPCNSGYGVGLPLSRLYAQYLGGSLNLMSMPGEGTTAFLHLKRSLDGQGATSLVVTKDIGGTGHYPKKH